MQGSATSRPGTARATRVPLGSLTVLLRDLRSPRVGAEAWPAASPAGTAAGRPTIRRRWTFRVAANAVHRRTSAPEAQRRPAGAGAPGPALDERAGHRAVASRPGELPQRQREAVVLRYVGDLTEAQTAPAMGVAPGTVAATLSSARRTLARRLELQEDHDDHARGALRRAVTRERDATPHDRRPAHPLRRRYRRRVAMGTTAVAVLLMVAAVGGRARVAPQRRVRAEHGGPPDDRVGPRGDRSQAVRQLRAGWSEA